MVLKVSEPLSPKKHIVSCVPLKLNYKVKNKTLTWYFMKYLSHVLVDLILSIIP